MDLTNLKLLQALSGLNPYQEQDQNSFNAPEMPKDDMFSGLFKRSPFNGGSTPTPLASPEFSNLLQHGAQDQLNQLLQSQPQHGDFNPSFMRKLGSGLISVTDPRLGDEVLNRKYNNAMEDWSGKLKPLSELADAERASNTNTRLMQATVDREEKADKDRKSREDIASAKDATARESIAQRDRYLAYKQYQLSHPNHIYKSDSEGNVYSINPQTNETEYILDDEGEMIKGDKLPELKRIEIQQNNRMTQIGAQHANRMGEIAASGGEARKTAETRGNESRKTKVVTPGKNTTPVETKTTEKHKIGEEKVFPNGNVGRWDGTGWLNTGKKAK